MQKISQKVNETYTSFAKGSSQTIQNKDLLRRFKKLSQN